MIVGACVQAFSAAGMIEASATLYSEAIPAMIRALKSEGQIVFCLPGKSHNGQPISHFAVKQIIPSQLVHAAESRGREVILNGSVKPTPEEIFRPPYYWQSERALTRTILHFRIQMR
jgi:hypothetical protein